MFETPQAEHHWLDSFVGNWESEMTADCGPDQPPSTSKGTHTFRSIGGLWIFGEGKTSAPDGGEWISLWTIGYDPKAGRYVGSFIATMMTFQWIYNGSVDETGKKLVLDTDGPKFDQSGMTKYQDILEKVNDDHWRLNSQMLGDDGQWKPFMSADYRRVK